MKADRLKFTVSYGKTINLGNYESEKLVLSKEYYQDDTPIDFAFRECRHLVTEYLREVKNNT